MARQPPTPHPMNETDTSQETRSPPSGRRVPTSDDLEVSTYLEIAREREGEQPLEKPPEAPPRPETIVILDFGSQYSMLIARRVRECNVYCELVPWDAPWERVRALNPRDFILSGGPASVYDRDAPLAPAYVFETGLPVLGICYGMQLLAHQLGGRVAPSQQREYGHALIRTGDTDSPLFAGLPMSFPVWMSHGDRVIDLADDLEAAEPARLVLEDVDERLADALALLLGVADAGQRVQDTFHRHLRIPLVFVDASDRFLERLAGVTDPEEKRTIVGETFIRVFEEEADKLGRFDFIAQGTTYPDVIESAAGSGAAAKIKTHHNVGGLPREMTFQLVEPLRYLFKDEVRRVGLALGLPEEMVFRQPFPGPGLAIRIIGEVTREKLEVLRSCDWIVMDEIKQAGLYRDLWQAFAILTDSRSVGVMGDFRTYGHVVALRAVTAEDAMTADWARLPYDVLARIAGRIVNEVPAVNRVVYDITSKPPGTIEWE
ncbi:MAG: glutamine-hydrolyzing GMP synthase [Chloroflexi bacterium]|nr:glutamine-hydrolyzing GMP synthase [Chloroflexota bacterium]